MIEKEKLTLERQACRVRKSILDGTFAAKSGHPGGSLGAADIFTYLYFKELDIDPKNPAREDRDRFVLSKGHTAPGLYAALAHRGYFPLEAIQTLRHIGSHLQGHPSMKLTPGVDMSTGSLGQGISTACGMALACRMKDVKNRVYTLLGDGEIEEGQCWEAFMFAAHYALDNLCVVIDINGLQIDGPTAEVMNAEPIDEKMRAFGFEVIDINGHDFEAMEAAFDRARATKGKPTAILARTSKGRGISFMENQASWHGKAPNEEQYSAACAEISKRYEELGGDGDV